MKELLRGAAQRSLEAQLEAEARALGVCAGTDDFAEAIGAFLAKRKPAFKGRLTQRSRLGRLTELVSTLTNSAPLSVH